jgi:hypothetical protein
MATATLNDFGVFGDEVFSSTDLNRRSGEVLNHAREHPITISRNNEQFALLRREMAAKLVRTVNSISSALEVLSQARVAIAGGSVSPAFAWLTIFEKGDLERLSAEVLEASREAANGSSDWVAVGALIHEWRESAAVAQSGVLEHAMYGETSQECPLSSPDEVMSDKTDEPELECVKD